MITQDIVIKESKSHKDTAIDINVAYLLYSDRCKQAHMKIQLSKQTDQHLNTVVDVGRPSFQYSCRCKYTFKHSCRCKHVAREHPFMYYCTNKCIFLKLHLMFILSKFVERSDCCVCLLFFWSVFKFCFHMCLGGGWGRIMDVPLNTLPMCFLAFVVTLILTAVQTKMKKECVWLNFTPSVNVSVWMMKITL